MMNGLKRLFKKWDIDWHDVRANILLLIWLLLMMGVPYLFFF